MDMCVQTAEAPVGVFFEVADVSNSVLKTGTNLLLHCDEHGADSVILEAVREHRGDLFTVPFSDWLDDGFGGPPRTLKMPPRPYTRPDGDRVFQKWLDFLRES